MSRKRLPLFGVLVIIVIVVSILLGILITYWLNHNTIKFQSPIVLRTPVWVEVKEDPRVAELRNQMLLLEQKLKTSEASLSAMPKDVPVVQQLMKQSDASVLKQQKHPIILTMVRQLESSGGLNDICKNKGMVNGFGFAQSDSSLKDGTYACYNSLSEVAEKVDNWFTEKLKTRSLAKSLCLYNKGIETEDCPYARNFLILASK